MDVDTDLQLFMMLNISISLFETIVIMAFIIVQYSSTYQRRLIQLTPQSFLKSCTSTAVWQESHYKYSAAIFKIISITRLFKMLNLSKYFWWSTTRSVLGPLLLLMYVKDLPNCFAFQTVLYADDTYLIVSHQNLNILQDLVNSELVNVIKWMHLNKLSINYSKSGYMTTRSMKHLCSPTELTSFSVYVNNVLLQGAACVKYLGVLIGSRLDWPSHVHLIKRKLL